MVSDVVGTQVARVRRAAGINREELAERCKRLGYREITPAALTNLESGRKDRTGQRRRHITVDELLVIACALDVSPLDLLVPGTAADDELYSVAPEETTTVGTAREWIGGGFLKHPKSPAEVFEAVRFMPKERADALAGKWFKTILDDSIGKAWEDVQRERTTQHDSVPPPGKEKDHDT